MLIHYLQKDLWGDMNNILHTPSPSMNFFMEGGLLFYEYIEIKHKKCNFSATVHLTRKKFIFPGRYLKANHFEKKLNREGGLFKKAEG